jgi:hypothetical protein
MSIGAVIRSTSNAVAAVYSGGIETACVRLVIAVGVAIRERISVCLMAFDDCFFLARHGMDFAVL